MYLFTSVQMMDAEFSGFLYFFNKVHYIGMTRLGFVAHKFNDNTVKLK